MSPPRIDYMYSFVVIGDKGVKQALETNLLKTNSPTNRGQILHNGIINKAEKQFEVGNRKVKLFLWDLKEGETMLEKFYEGLRLVLLVFDITNPASFDNIRSHYKDISSISSNLQMVLIGNKTDLKDRKVTEEQARELAKELSIPYYEVSSKTGRNVENTFHTITHSIITEREKVQPYVKHEIGGMCTIL